MTSIAVSQTLLIRKSTTENTALRDFLLITGGSLLVALLAQLKIALPFTLVPITGQTLGVLLVGASLGSRRGAATILLYLLEGSLGLPFFAGGTAGIAALIGPTGGYLLGFVAAAFVAGLLAEKKMDRNWTTVIPAFLAAHTAVFVIGVPWLAVFVGKSAAIKTGFYPFIPGEIIKSTLAAIMIRSAWSAKRTV